MIDDRDALLLNFRYDPQPLVRDNETFGNVWYDPVASLWRLWVHEGTAGTAGTVVQYDSSSSRGPWSNRATALGHGEAGAWDEQQTGVPYVWYEAGEGRPWRMLYRGARVSDGRCQIGLATSTDGTTWERKDTAGNVLSAPVIPSGSSGWDSASIDGGSVIKVGSTYYHFYNTISNPRQVGLATSTDLATWTKHGSNPLWTAVSDFQDKTQDGTPNNACGFFCGDCVRWDELDGTIRYAMFLPHYTGVASQDSIDLYVCPNPTFLKADRTYIGEAFASDASPAWTLESADISSLDTPRIITDTIARNVLTSTLTGKDVLSLIAVYTVRGWNQAWLVHHRDLHGSILSNVCADLPVAAPVYRLLPTAPDANTKLLYLPASTGSLRELSAYDAHLYGKYTLIDASGIKFTAANSEFCRHDPASGTIDRLNAITTAWTLEVQASIPANFTTERHLFDFGSSGAWHWQFYLTWSVDQYIVNIKVLSGAADQQAGWYMGVGALGLNTLYRFALCCNGTKAYVFLDGVLKNAGGTNYAHVLDATPNAAIWIGGRMGSAYFWNGSIAEVRVSDSCRWTANYTPAALTHKYQASGSIFGRVHDFGKAGYLGRCELTQSAPANTTITKKSRKAATLTDQSQTDGDFTAYADARPLSRYQQHEIVLATSDTTITPAVSEARISGRAIGSRRWRGRMGGN